MGRAISHGGAGYHRHYPTHHPQFGELLRARKRHLAVFQHRNLSFHNPFSVGYDSVSKPVVSGLFIWNESEALVVVQTMALFYSTFPSYERLSDIATCCEIFVVCSNYEAFLKATITFPLIFLIISIKMGRNRLQMGSKEVCSAWFPLPTSTLVEEVEK